MVNKKPALIKYSRSEESNASAASQGHVGQQTGDASSNHNRCFQEPFGLPYTLVRRLRAPLATRLKLQVMVPFVPPRKVSTNPVGYLC